MPGAGDALRGRTFGIPNVALLAAVAFGIYWFFIRGRTGAKAPSGTSPTGQATTDYSLGYAQGIQASMPGGVTQGPSAPQILSIRQSHADDPNAPTAQWDKTFRGVPIRPRPGPVGFIGLVPFGSTIQATGQPVQGDNNLGSPASPSGPTASSATPQQGVSTWWPVGYAGAIGYLSAYDVSGQGQPGVGVGGPSRKHAIGSRSANLYHDAHPLIGASVRYAHYVRVGGPRTAAAHHANIHSVAQQAGVHPARVAMLNPVPTGLIRIA